MMRTRRHAVAPARGKLLAATLILALAAAFAQAPAARAQHGAAPDSAAPPQSGHVHAAPPSAPQKNFLGDAARGELKRLVIQDFQQVLSVDSLEYHMQAVVFIQLEELIVGEQRGL